MKNNLLVYIIQSKICKSFYVSYGWYVIPPDTKLFDKDGIWPLGVAIRFVFFQYGINLFLFGFLDLFTLSACFSEFICTLYWDWELKNLLQISQESETPFAGLDCCALPVDDANAVPWVTTSLPSHSPKHQCAINTIYVSQPQKR